VVTGHCGVTKNPMVTAFFLNFIIFYYFTFV